MRKYFFPLATNQKEKEEAKSFELINTAYYLLKNKVFT